MLLSAGANDGDINILTDQLNDDFVWYYPTEYQAPIELFLACYTQWRTGMAGAIGLDYVAVDVTRKMLGIKLKPEQFRLLQVMENEALKMMAG